LHTDLRQHLFSDRFIDIWNKLDEEPVSAKSLNSFKRRLQNDIHAWMGHFQDQSSPHKWPSGLNRIPEEGITGKILLSSFVRDSKSRNHCAQYCTQYITEQFWLFFPPNLQAIINCVRKWYPKVYWWSGWDRICGRSWIGFLACVSSTLCRCSANDTRRPIRTIVVRL